ncbi:flagellar biosynthetic protein FliR [Caldicellulosiruptoraceae bacterium PP1]
MDYIINVSLNNASIFFLILVRMSGIFIASPIFGRRNIPAYFKIGFAFFTSIAVFFMFNFKYDVPQDIIQYSFLVIKEFAVGLIVGFITYIVFTTILLAGQIIDTSIGFGVANVIDPMSEIQVPLIGNFLYMLMLLMFFITDAHHVLIRGIFYSYKIIPFGRLSISKIFISHFLEIFIKLFVIGIEISLPILLSMLVVDIILGVLSRAVPQMNVFMVGLPLKIIIGILILVILLPFFSKMILVLIDKIGIYMFEVLKGMI